MKLNIHYLHYIEILFHLDIFKNYYIVMKADNFWLMI